MTAPLPTAAPATSPLAAAITATPRHMGKGVKPHGFALPEPPSGPTPDGAPEQGGAAASTKLSDGREAGIPLPEPVPPMAAQPATAIALPTTTGPAPEAAIAGPETASVSDRPENLSPKDNPTAEEPPASDADARVAPPAAPFAPPIVPLPASPAAAAPPARAPASAPPASQTAEKAQPASPRAPSTSPVAAAPAGSPPVSPETGAESRQPSTRRDDRAPQRTAGAQASAAQAAPQMPPFRMEAPLPPPQLPDASAVREGAATPAGASTALAPDMAADATPHTPDVVVELVGADALDVTISAATPDSLDRMSAAEPELRHELARLGAEVEAIRMELRPEAGSERPGPDRGHEHRNHDRGADGVQTSASGDQGRQGDRMMRQNDLRETRLEGRLTAGRALRLNAETEAGAGRATVGRIDRYA